MHELYKMWDSSMKFLEWRIEAVVHSPIILPPLSPPLALFPLSSSILASPIPHTSRHAPQKGNIRNNYPGWTESRTGNFRTKSALNIISKRWWNERKQFITYVNLQKTDLNRMYCITSLKTKMLTMFGNLIMGINLDGY